MNMNPYLRSECFAEDLEDTVVASTAPPARAAGAPAHRLFLATALVAALAAGADVVQAQSPLLTAKVMPDHGVAGSPQ